MVFSGFATEPLINRRLIIISMQPLKLVHNLETLLQFLRFGDVDVSDTLHRLNHLQLRLILLVEDGALLDALY